MGKIQEMYCHICQDIISSLSQTALSRVEILLSNGVSAATSYYLKGKVFFIYRKNEESFENLNFGSSMIPQLSLHGTS